MRRPSREPQEYMFTGRNARNSAFDSPWKYLFIKIKRWIFPAITVILILAFIRNYNSIMVWIDEVRQWEADLRRGPFHAHNRPRFDGNGKARRNPFVVIFGDISDEGMLRFVKLFIDFSLDTKRFLLCSVSFVSLIVAVPIMFLCTIVILTH